MSLQREVDGLGFTMSLKPGSRAKLSNKLTVPLMNYSQQTVEAPLLSKLDDAIKSGIMLAPRVLPVGMLLSGDGIGSFLDQLYVPVGLEIIPEPSILHL